MRRQAMGWRSVRHEESLRPRLPTRCQGKQQYIQQSKEVGPALARYTNWWRHAVDVVSAPIASFSPCGKRITCITCSSERHQEKIARRWNEQLQHVLSRGHDGALRRHLDKATYKEHARRRQTLRSIAKAARITRSADDKTAESAPAKRSATPMASEDPPSRSRQGQRHTTSERT